MYCLQLISGTRATVQNMICVIYKPDWLLLLNKFVLLADVFPFSTFLTFRIECHYKMDTKKRKMTLLTRLLFGFVSARIARYYAIDFFTISGSYYEIRQ